MSADWRNQIRVGTSGWHDKHWQPVFYSVDDWGGKDIERLFGAMRDVLETTVQCQADPGRFPDSYLTPEERRESPVPAVGDPSKA